MKWTSSKNSGSRHAQQRLTLIARSLGLVALALSGILTSTGVGAPPTRQESGGPFTKNGIPRYIILTLLCLGLACGVTACAPRLVGPTTASGYFFSMQVSSPVIWLGTVAEVSVRVQDARGQLVDGVAVTFEVEPEWAQHASVSPSQVTMRGGVARTIFEAQLTGVVRITARVDNTTAQTRVVVQDPLPAFGVGDPVGYATGCPGQRRLYSCTMAPGTPYERVYTHDCC